MSLELTFFQPPTLPSVFSELTAKNVKTSKSHDGATLTSFDLFIDKVKIGRVAEDDWSGDVFLDEINADTKKVFDEFCDRKKVVEHVSEKYSVQADSTYTLIAIYDCFRDINGYKSITRKSVKNLMVGTQSCYISISWTKTKLSDVSTNSLQSELKKLVLSAKSKGVSPTVLNTPEQLKELGVDFEEVKK